MYLYHLSLGRPGGIQVPTDQKTPRSQLLVLKPAPSKGPSSSESHLSVTFIVAVLQCAIYGSFSGPKTQEIIVSRGNLLELLRPDENGKMQIICSTNVFGVIRALSPFSLAGTVGKEKQYIILAGDSGRIVILEYNKDRNVFAKIHQETFGKSGCRRIVPGQYLAVDPRGRACMIGAVEKQKLVYVLNRDAAAKLTISSPLEAHKSHNIVFSVCGLDNGFENPIFATIELDYADTDQV